MLPTSGTLNAVKDSSMIVIEHLHIHADGLIPIAQKILETLTEVKQTMATLAEQVAELKTTVNDFGVAIDAEIVQINAKLDALTQENPDLAAAIADIKAQTEKVHGIIADSPVVPSVT